jgi:hypothetical protein
MGALSNEKIKKANSPFALAWVVGADGIEPPTYSV